MATKHIAGNLGIQRNTNKQILSRYHNTKVSKLPVPITAPTVGRQPSSAAASHPSLFDQNNAVIDSPVSNSQPWPLSQEAHKLSGICSVCGKSRQLKRKDDTVHIHGHRDSRCAGSNKPPLQVQAIPSASAPDASNNTDAHTTHATNLPSSPAVFSHPELCRPLIKHIPKSARVSCCSRLSRLLQDIARNPNNIDLWDEIFKFGESILIKPDRGGKQHNLENTTKKRTCEAFHPTTTPHQTTDHHPRKGSSNKSAETILAEAVMERIEDGNLKGAIRLLCTEDKPAPNNKSTLTQLQLRHPSAPHDRRDIPPPATFIPLQVSENDVIHAICSFPAGSAGGPDGIRPQHILDLVNCKESGVGMLTSIRYIFH